MPARKFSSFQCVGIAALEQKSAVEEEPETSEKVSPRTSILLLLYLSFTKGNLLDHCTGAASGDYGLKDICNGIYVVQSLTRWLVERSFLSSQGMAKSIGSKIVFRSLDKYYLSCLPIQRRNSECSFNSSIAIVLSKIHGQSSMIYIQRRKKSGRN